MRAFLSEEVVAQYSKETQNVIRPQQSNILVKI